MKSKWAWMLLALVGVWVLWMPRPEYASRYTEDSEAQLAQWTATQPPGPELTASAGRLVIDLKDGRSLEALQAIYGDAVQWAHPLAEDEGLAVVEVADLAAAGALLRGVEGIEAMEPSLQAQAYGFPDDPMYDRQWNLRMVEAATGWKGTSRGRGVVVAVLDTGVSVVEDLPQEVLLPGVSFVPGEPDSTDGNGHGTHVAGTIAQATNNGIGVASIAPNAKILPVKVLSAFGSGTSEQIAAGIDYAVDQGADVINLSLGMPQSSAVIHVAIQKAVKAGVVVVAASGNDGLLSVGYPAAFPEVIAVGAVGPSGKRTAYSNGGARLSISAPGGDTTAKDGGILQSTISRDGSAYKALQGTSMASPHVAGAAAVLLSEGVRPAAVRGLLERGAVPSDMAPWTPTKGWGVLNLRRSLWLVGAVDQWMLFGLGMLGAFALAGLAGLSAGGRLGVSLLGGWASGGLFLLPSSSSTLVSLLERGPMTWGAWLWPGTLGELPVWFGALGLGVVAILASATRGTRLLALGLGAGVLVWYGAHASTGLLTPWWAPGAWGSLWFGGTCVFAGLALLGLAGIERMSEGER